MAEKSEIFELLLHPVPDEMIAVKEGGGKSKQPYVEHEVLTEYLNEICGAEWEFDVEVVSMTANEWIVKGTLTICGVSRSDYGQGEGAAFGGPSHKAYSAALSRCAMRFGVALECWKNPHAALARAKGNGSGHKPKPQKKKPAPKPTFAPNEVQNSPSGADAIVNTTHWTEDQNWKAFWSHAKNTLNLTEDEVHQALGVDSVKQFRGAKGQASMLLKAASEQKAREQTKQSMQVVKDAKEPRKLTDAEVVELFEYHKKMKISSKTMKETVLGCAIGDFEGTAAEVKSLIDAYVSKKQSVDRLLAEVTEQKSAS